MKMDMVKEFEDFIYWLENEFVDYYLTLRNSAERGIWESVLEMHLESANFALDLAKKSKEGFFSTKALNDEAAQKAEGMFNTYFEAMPEQAFMGRMGADK